MSLGLPKKCHHCSPGHFRGKLWQTFLGKVRLTINRDKYVEILCFIIAGQLRSLKVNNMAQKVNNVAEQIAHPLGVGKVMG